MRSVRITQRIDCRQHENRLSKFAPDFIRHTCIGSHVSLGCDGHLGFVEQVGFMTLFLHNKSYYQCSARAISHKARGYWFHRNKPAARCFCNWATSPCGLEGSACLPNGDEWMKIVRSARWRNVLKFTALSAPLGIKLTAPICWCRESEQMFQCNRGVWVSNGCENFEMFASACRFIDWHLYA